MCKASFHAWNVCQDQCMIHRKSYHTLVKLFFKSSLVTTNDKHKMWWNKLEYNVLNSETFERLASRSIPAGTGSTLSSIPSILVKHLVGETSGCGSRAISMATHTAGELRTSEWKFKFLFVTLKGIQQFPLTPSLSRQLMFICSSHLGSVTKHLVDLPQWVQSSTEWWQQRATAVHLHIEPRGREDFISRTPCLFLKLTQLTDYCPTYRILTVLFCSQRHCNDPACGFTS